MQRRVLILAGGGGHTGYAEILAQEFNGRAELSFLAPEDEPISVKRLTPYGNVDTLIKPRHPTTPFLSFLIRFLKALIQSLSKINKEYHMVICTGSNFCVPPALVAWMKGVPVVILESRVKFKKPSRTTWLLRFFAKIVALQWDEQLNFIEGEVFGPVLPQIKVDPWDGGYILVSGGTYGYEQLFDAVSDTNLTNVVLQTGKIDGEKYQKAHPDWKVISYTNKFHELIAGAQVVVSPPGGTPVESATYGKSCVVVVYPGWAKAADLEETQMFAEKINAVFLTEVKPESLVNAIEEAKNRNVPVFKNGAKALIDEILDQIDQSRRFK